MQSRQALDPPRAGHAGVTLEHALIAARARVMSNPGVDALRGFVQEAGQSNVASLTASRQVEMWYGAALAASRLRDFVAARAHLDRLTAVVRSDASAARLSRLLAAEIALTGGDTTHAAAVLQPDAQSPGDAGAGPTTMRRPELFLGAQTALKSSQGGALGAISDATQRLQAWVTLHPRDAQAWQLLSGLYEAQGQPLRAIRAQAEAQVAVLDYAAALDRFKAAQEYLRQARVGNAAADHIDASIIDTRKRQVELLLKEQALDR